MALMASKRLAVSKLPPFRWWSCPNGPRSPSTALTRFEREGHHLPERPGAVVDRHQVPGCGCAVAARRRLARGLRGVRDLEEERLAKQLPPPSPPEHPGGG